MTDTHSDQSDYARLTPAEFVATVWGDDVISIARMLVLREAEAWAATAQDQPDRVEYLNAKRDRAYELADLLREVDHRV